MSPPTTRTAALLQLEAWLDGPVKDYAHRRNTVEPGHANVSRLAPAIRHRLITEHEVIAHTLAQYPFERVEKFVQEVAWRLYWKSWLEMRPDVWTHYCHERDHLRDAPPDPAALAAAEAGGSGLGIIDHFARELIDTGYLHNHARMWFAAWWVHVARLPWQLGADFFLRHLLDGDAASNTLSWRWVAGLHTRGKSYLIRRSNLEKCLHPALLKDHRLGLDRLADELMYAVGAAPLPEEPGWERQPPAAWDAPPEPQAGDGIWIHPEHLALPRGWRHTDRPRAVTAPSAIWQADALSPARIGYLNAVCQGAATAHDAALLTSSPGQALCTWASEHGITRILTVAPWVGELHDGLPSVRAALEEKGVSLQLFRPEEDQPWLAHATAGFFGFWKRFQKTIPNL